MNPFVRRIFVQRECALLASHCPKVIETIARRRRDGMITVGQQHGISISHLVRDRFAVAGIDRLISKSLWWINAEVIHLFKSRFAVTAVVFVRRETAPIAPPG